MDNSLQSHVNSPKRIVSWWIRMADLSWPSHDGYEKIKRRAEEIANANATAAMIFGTHFRWDFLPYFTLLHDYIATVAEELHKNGVKLYDHHSVNLIHRYDTRDEMRHVMLHSAPHLPLSPSREAAATWEYNGRRLNDWRMIDVRSRDVIYFPQYAAEGFCISNPDFIEAYKEYLKQLIKDTNIDGLSADDPVHYMYYNSCACPHCRERLKKRAGIDLPAGDDKTFWGNWENPAWSAWIDLRFEAASEFFDALRPVFPNDFMLTTCGSKSAGATANGMATDATRFISGGCNYVNLEMSGNMPPYKHDSVTTNLPIANRIINSSHHQAVARKNKIRYFSTGFGFTRETADIVWAVSKAIGADCWFSTLKDRLGLPDSILNTLPDEPQIIDRAFTFEATHKELFDGEAIGQVGVYFSYETRNHTYFGNLSKGYAEDYGATVRSLFQNCLNPHTVFEFPSSPDVYPIIIVSSTASMTDTEIADMKKYIASGGRIVMTGPVPNTVCNNKWKLPNSPELSDSNDFFSYIVNGVKHRNADWELFNTVEDTTDANEWQEPMEGLLYNPHRITVPSVEKDVIGFCEKYCKPLPVKIYSSNGYLVSMFQNENAITVHLLAEDFDTDIDHKLDEMRFHRSRVNYINKVEPIGVTDTVSLSAFTAPTVYLPFSDTEATVKEDNGSFTITLPEKTAYAILSFALN